MDNMAIESFITHCDDMMIAEESNINGSKKNASIRIIEIKENDFKKYAIQHAAVRNNYDKFKESYNGEIIVDTENDKLIGCVFVGDKKDKGFITTLWVNNKYRSKGFGTILLKDAINKFGGYDLTVLKGNENAIALYKKHGFVVIGYGNERNKSDYWMKLKSKLTKDDKPIDD